MICTCPTLSGGYVAHRINCPQADVATLRRVLEAAEAEVRALRGALVGEASALEQMADQLVTDKGEAQAYRNCAVWIRSLLAGPDASFALEKTVTGLADEWERKDDGPCFCGGMHRKLAIELRAALASKRP